MLPATPDLITGPVVPIGFGLYGANSSPHSYGRAPSSAGVYYLSFDEPNGIWVVGTVLGDAGGGDAWAESAGDPNGAYTAVSGGAAGQFDIAGSTFT